MSALFNQAKAVVELYRSQDLGDVPKPLCKAIEDLGKLVRFHERFNEIRESLRKIEESLIEANVPPNSELRGLIDTARRTTEREIKYVDSGSDAALVKIR